MESLGRFVNSLYICNQNDKNMELLKELIYEDRKGINEFHVYDKSSLNHLVFRWLLTQVDLKPFESGLPQRRLQVFNDAYYICTLAMMRSAGGDFVSYAYKKCSMPSIVFPMVYVFISKVGERDNSNLLEVIKTGLKSRGWEDNLTELIKMTENYPDNLSPSEFAQRELTPELLSSIRWFKATGKYAKDDILKIVKYIS